MNRRDLVFLTGSFALLAPGRAAFSDQRVYKIRDLYNRDGSFSEFAVLREGERMTFSGFMAPPIKAEASFFVLTKLPMAVCPFCKIGTDWPNDILPIYTKRVTKVVPFDVPITATGILEMGEYVDEETGFYSLVRLVDATYED